MYFLTTEFNFARKTFIQYQTYFDQFFFSDVMLKIYCLTLIELNKNSLNTHDSFHTNKIESVGQ
jgi:hypothetical protein